VYLASLLIKWLNHLLVVLAMRTWAVWQSSPWILAFLIFLVIVGNRPVSIIPTHRIVEGLCGTRDRDNSA
jgi:hypothetical protein